MTIVHQQEYQPSQDAANHLEAGKTPRRWVVERLFSWLNRWRRLLVRWEKLSETYRAFVQLACGLICFHYTSRVSVFGQGLILQRHLLNSGR